MARKHQIVSPARHFVDQPSCVSCLKWYGSVPAAQNHMRKCTGCVWRAVQIMEPLSLCEINQVKAAHRSQLRLLRKGKLQEVKRHVPVLQAMGPPGPLYSERFPPGYEDGTLEDLAKHFRPQVQHLEWIRDYLDSATVVGPTTVATDFWNRRSSQSTQLPTNPDVALLLKNSGRILEGSPIRAS